MKVIPIVGEVGRYQVESRSKRDVPFHTVDILEDECGCKEWVCNHRKYREEHGRAFRCAHIKAAREYGIDDLIEVMREHALRQ